MKIKCECNCNDWKENTPIIETALTLALQHGMSGLKKSTRFCMYCGSSLTQSKPKGDKKDD